MIQGGSKPVIQLHPFYPAYFCIGKKGAGKSALLERMLEVYYQEGYQVMDMNCAADLESLHWSVPHPDRPSSSGYPILVILPASTSMRIFPRTLKLADGREVEAIKTISDSTSFAEIIREALKEKRVIVFSIHLYDSEAKGQLKFSHFIKEFPRVVRDHMPRDLKFAIGLRELSDLSSNRMLTFSGGGERESKRGLNYFSRVARHSRTVLVLDMQDPDQVYSALTAQEDFILVKRLNKHHIPEKLNWLKQDIGNQIEFAKQHYLMSKLQAVSLDRLTNNSFYCVWPDGEYSLEHNSQPQGFRHHESDDDALALAGVSLKFLTKQELEQSDQGKIEYLKKKQAAKAEREQQLVNAYEMYRQRKAENIAYSWNDCAKDCKFFGADGKPAGNTLRIAINRLGERGGIPSYHKLAENDSKDPADQSS